MKRLGGWDAVLLYSENPNSHQHTVKAGVIDASASNGSFNYHSFRRALEARLHLLDPLRYQLIDIPLGLHHPMWLENCDVDLDYHARRYFVRSPGDRNALDEAIGDIASTPLARDRPLWEFYFIEGLTNDRYAIVGKMHHAVADGLASANLLARALDPDIAPEDEGRAYSGDQYPSRGKLVRQAMADHVGQIMDLPGLLRDTGAGIQRVRRNRRTVPGLARRFAPPPTFINHPVGPRRRFASAIVTLTEMKETSKKLGITINDLVLAIGAGALRALQLRYDDRADAPLLCGVPVSTDLSPDRISGNALGLMVISLPVDVEDVLERVRLTAVATEIGKQNNALLGRELMSRWSNYLPPAVGTAAFSWLGRGGFRNRLVNVSISNVPGPRVGGRIVGAPMSELLSVGTLTFGVGLNITVWSYVDHVTFNVLEDAATVNDPHEVTDAMVAEFAAIRHAAGLSSQLSEPSSALV
ncbi:WS/DGAT/MGAT family O-acyltransferase [Mycobacterium kyogaense]|uniref:WS/DGAT/MGAT family O-acyltransferase n=1 Tax=Mycobacterium kyogaense TaxID=2212479 RepID=UPI000DADD576|nr:wax ester/triacylglycerol synthase family O-acyltransferase [Mycobacterium kyogaense]